MSHLVVGAVWRCKRRGERHRTVLIRSLTDRGYVRYFEVRRNTSRRTQAISEATLLKDYEFERMADD